MAARLAKTMPASHTAGIFADMSLDGPEIGTLVAVVDRARNLPNRKTMGKQDPYCAIRLGKEAKKTETDRRGGQTPKWDQELRFTIHESPDYLKLKCSVFNDDKKTDLIGEAWINIGDIVVPGGGQNDLWHQLNYRGKYAGEIRLELTYYDQRPKPEPLSEKRSKREKRVHESSEQTDNSASQRHIGPREIKKRPLPPSPGAATSAVEDSHSNLQRERQTQPSAQYMQPEVPSLHHHHQQQQQQHQPPAVPPKQPIYPETPDDFSNFSQPQADDFGGTQRFYEEPSDYRTMNHFENQPSRFDNALHTANPSAIQHAYSGTQIHAHDYVSTPPQSQFHSPYISTEQSFMSDVPSPLSIREKQAPTQYYSPPSQSFPSYIPSDRSVIVPSASGGSSPNKSVSYRDSPLRQSMALTDISMPYGQFNNERESFEEPPPPPPAHGGQFRTLVHHGQSEPYDSKPQGNHLPFERGSIDYRSPLQQIEHNYESNVYEIRLPHSHSAPELPQRHSNTISRESSFGDPNQNICEPTKSTPTRQKSHNAYVATEAEEMAQAIILADVPTSEELTDRKFFSQERGRYPSRGDFPPSPPTRSGPFNIPDVQDEPYTYRSQPQVVRPRAVSPATPHSIPRKSISPHPYSQEDRQSISAIPFSPDSYDVYNPGSSPAADFSMQNAAPENTKEIARQREVNKLRDQGPIIGNDGRVIDPSDHLPSDTWAPEPERKVRQPEHVIRVRTREEARSRARASPVALGPRSAPSTPQTVATSLPNNVTTSSSGGRNRLEKQTPPRPLPTQPFVHSQVNAAVPQHYSPSEHQYVPTSRNSPLYAGAGSAPIYRPPLAEYQVPETQSYSPRVSTYQPSWQTTPTKTSHNPSNYAQENLYNPENSLATEMSMIDIGPPRGNRTAVRSNRPYGMY